MSIKSSVLDSVQRLQAQVDNIRNFCFIAHVDHGKTTLSDSLVHAGGLLSEERMGHKLFMHTSEEEKQKGITMRSSGISLPVTFKGDAKMIRKLQHDKLKAALKEQGVNVDEDFAADDDDDKKMKKDNNSNNVFAQAKLANLPLPPTTSLTVPESERKEFLFNLIDSPGHVDFSSEVSAALRLTDGAIVVVDAVEGVCVQTQTVLRQALAERVKPVLFFNKLDRLFTELGLEAEEAYQRLKKTVENVNVLISTLQDLELEDMSIFPEAGSVGFGSGLQGWGFTLEDFAMLYHDRFDMSVKKMMKKLWGENFYNPKTNQWVQEQYTENGEKLQRGFCYLVYRPLKQIYEAIRSNKVDDVRKMLSKLNLSHLLSANSSGNSSNSTNDDSKLIGADKIIHSWLPVQDALIRMVVQKLPNPRQAQAYRVQNLYSGPPIDEAATAIRACDPNAGLMMCISKMVLATDHTRFYAFGRVYSGTLTVGQQVRIQGPEFVPGQKQDLVEKRISSVVLMMGPATINVSSVSAGGICALVGVDDFISKTATITTMENAHNFVSMKFSVAPVVRIAVQPSEPQFLAKLTPAMKKLAKTDPLVETTITANGEYIIAACGELHLEACLQNLRKLVKADNAFKTSKPVVAYRETISSASSQEVMAKSQNKHNRIHMTAEPLSEDLTRNLENGSIFNGSSVGTEELKGAEVKMAPISSNSNFNPATASTALNNSTTSKLIAKQLVERQGWESQDARAIWATGQTSETIGNTLVNMSRAVPYLHDVKDAVCGAFASTLSAGVLCEEPIRGVRFNIKDAKVHQDPSHRQMPRCVRDAMYAAQLVSNPRLVEPMFLCEIVTSKDHVAGVYRVLRERRATIENRDTFDASERDTASVTVRAFVPVMESFGFTETLHKYTGGHAFPQMQFSHWEVMPGDPLDVATVAGKTVREIRTRKGLKVDIPALEEFHSKQ